MNKESPDLKDWTANLLKQYGIKAGQRMGQHFLIDAQVLEDIVDNTKFDWNIPVLEVGGGFGVLTLALLEQKVKVVVVELDKKLVVGLQKLSRVSSSLQVVEGDVLKISDAVLQKHLNIKIDEPFIIVANLPYEISGKFLRRFLGGAWRPQTMTLLLQKEVGERLVASPGQMSLLSLQTQLATKKAEIVRLIPPTAFWPAPKVESCLIKLELKSSLERNNFLTDEQENQLWRLARIGFAARRKVLINNLLSALSLTRVEMENVFVEALVPISARAQELSLEQWKKLAKLLAK